MIAPCHFGMEAVLKREISDLGLELVSTEDGRVTFAGKAEDIARANVFLRSAERVLLKTASFRAVTFEELYEKTKAVAWEELLPKDAKFWVSKVSSVKSRLFSPSDIQSVMKKAMVDRLAGIYGIRRFPETGNAYPVRVMIYKDEVTVGLDTSGDSLHKRGYRVEPVRAPLSETLAASLIGITPWSRDRILVDPFCGSGTIPIEAAMRAKNIAPGMKRSFLAEKWEGILPAGSFKRAKEEARSLVVSNANADIQGYDIDPHAINCARINAKAAGCDDIIHFQVRGVDKLNHPKRYGFIITNPPYGERIGDGDMLPMIYRQLREGYDRLEDWSMYIITAYEDAEKYLGKKADKNRKIYNGMLKTYIYQYLGAKPPKKRPQG